ncbi:MAG TPA: NADH-quinone oxidoreductase subunit C, partial [Candidatus Eisenbacteria bacterium]|nr:NADH-quinone oxidoreductase subunit C [Candidatus Eisenbacteria bacterium]
VLVALLAYDAENTLAVARSEPVASRYPALTPRRAQAHLFEREVWEQHGLLPEGHPWLKPVRLDHGRGPAVRDFFRVEGHEVHEVAVGPVHAGIIEPGHFRFQCAGEEVMHLEIALGYQHRGVEEALIGGPHRATAIQMETVAGDTTIAHATAYASVLEALADSGEGDESGVGAEPPLRAQWLRAIALELERLANHTGDLGALAGDVAYLPTSAACGKIRGDFLNLTALIAGNRFGRGLVRPGGVRRDGELDPDRAAILRDRLRVAMADVSEAAAWLWSDSSVRARFEGTGVLSREMADEIGLVGPAVRACGLVRDVRFDHPAGWYRFAQVPVSVWPGGDVLARAQVRWLEIQRSGAYIEEQLAAPPEDDLAIPVGAPAPDSIAVSLVEGWRGEVCHVAVTDDAGRFRRYKIVDPSFHNWTGLALALRGQAISDFPLCNKSFNLSYCGFDL